MNRTEVIISSKRLLFYIAVWLTMDNSSQLILLTEYRHLTSPETEWSLSTVFLFDKTLSDWQNTGIFELPSLKASIITTTSRDFSSRYKFLSYLPFHLPSSFHTKSKRSLKTFLGRNTLFRELRGLIVFDVHKVHLGYLLRFHRSINCSKSYFIQLWFDSSVLLLRLLIYLVEKIIFLKLFRSSGFEDRLLFFSYCSRN